MVPYYKEQTVIIPIMAKILPYYATCCAVLCCAVLYLFILRYTLLRYALQVQSCSILQASRPQWQ
jgi:hypothetical protein